MTVSGSEATQAQSSVPPVANSSATSFGADTPGTNWKPIQDPESTANRGPALEAVSIILLCVTAMILVFRFFARWYTKTLRNTVQSIGWDDWLAVIALIGTAGITATIVLGTNHGMGKHLPVTTSLQDLEDILKVRILFDVIYLFTDNAELDYIRFCSHYRRCPWYPQGQHSLPLCQDDTYVTPQTYMLHHHELRNCPRHCGSFRLYLLMSSSLRILESFVSHNISKPCLHEVSTV